MVILQSHLISLFLFWSGTINFVSAGTKCTLNNGRCVYRVQLLDTCENNIPGSYDQIGQSEDSRITELEQKFSDAQTHYAKKLTSLETRISELTDLLFPNADANSYWTGTSFDRLENTIEKNDDFNIPFEPRKRPENRLLTQVHDHFTDLRVQLDEANRKLAEMERQLQGRQDELARSRDTLTDTAGELAQAKRNLAQVERQLLDAQEELARSQNTLTDTADRYSSCEVRLIKVEDEKQNLQTFLEQKLVENEEISARTDACNEEVRSKSVELYNVRDDNTQLRAELSRCRSKSHSVTRSHDLLIDEHHVLRNKHRNLTAKYNDTAAELQECHDRAVMAVRDARITAAARDEARRRMVKTASYCGFEDPNLCGFVNEAYYDDLDWRQWNGATPSRNTGPSHDHTCENGRGQYMYVSASAMARDLKARLISPKHRGNQEQCIEFYYFMYGGNVGILNVYFLVEGWDSQDLPPPVWRAFGNQGQMWTMARLSAPIDVVRDGYQVVFEARTEAGYEGDIALDDVRVFDGGCYGARTLEQVNAYNYNDRLDEINGWH